MSASSIRLEARGIAHAYRSLKVLDGIDLVVPPGEVMVLVGPSGCGKSTLLGILGGMLKPGGGEVRMDGALAPDCLNPLTYVFQDFSLLPWRDVAGNISLVLEDSGLAGGRAAGADRRDAGADGAGAVRQGVAEAAFRGHAPARGHCAGAWRCGRRCC